jgi:type IV secretory pathway ATPase VirB11/archaellum biosynthesis ATPase
MPDVANIEIHGWDSVVIQYGDGRRKPMPPVADSDAELIEAVRFLAQNSEPSRPFDDTHPTMTLALGERFRLHAMAFGLSYRPSIVIRQHTLTDVSLADLADGGLMPYEVAQFLDAAILARKSMVISGDQGAGKTTLLRALINSIPLNERFGTLETDYELMTHLQPGRENILALQARVGHGEMSGGSRIGDFTISELVPEALRQNLSRLVIGEVRGGEASAMFEAMQAGTGTLSTTHSHSAESTMDRLASRVAQGGVLTIDEAYRQIAHNIHLFIFVKLVDESWKGGTRRRYVSEIRQVTRAIEQGRPVTHLTYHAVGTARQPAGYFPDADFEAELLPFRRDLPRSSRNVRRHQ